jgi:hypothetical protein
MPKKVAKEYYVDGKDFLRRIKIQKTEPNKRNWEEIGKIFLKIATRQLTKTNYIAYSWDRKQDMITEATYLMVLRWKSFDETRFNNPFAYFTEIAKNAYAKKLGDWKYDDDFVSKIQFIDILGEESIDE